MGRRRKAATEPELMEVDSDLQPAKSSRQVVEAEHTIRFRKPLDVATLETEEEEADAEDVEEPEIEEPDEEQPRRRTALSFRTKLKKELGERGIGSDEQLRLRIDRLPYYEVNGNTGINAEKEFVRNIPCAKGFVLNDEYLDEVSKSCGPGAYWFTLRHKNTIVKMWHMKISGAPIAPATPEAGQVSPQVIYQSAPNQPQQPVAVQDPLAQMRQAFKLVREFRDDLGLVMSQQSPAPASMPLTDPKIAALQLIAENPDVMEKIGSGIAKTVLGSKGDDSDPWAEVAKEAIRSGQAPQIVATLIRELMAPFRNLWGNNNGQAPMAPSPVQNQTRPGESQQQGQPAPGQDTGQPANHGDGFGSVAEDVHRGEYAQVGAVTPEEIQRLVTQTPLRVSDAVDLVAQGLISAEELALMKVTANCQRHSVPQDTYNWLIQFANTINDEMPDFSIYDRIDLLGAIPTDQALDFVRNLPGGEQVTSLPHCRSWTESLQQIIKENQEGNEE